MPSNLSKRKFSNTGNKGKNLNKLNAGIFKKLAADFLFPNIGGGKEAVNLAES
jgi:hypothetical protein